MVGLVIPTSTKMTVFAGMAKLADALDLRPSEVIRGGSSPSIRISHYKWVMKNGLLY